MELLRDRSAEFEAAGVRPLGISRDSPWTHIAWMQALDLDFPLLSDWNGEAVRGLRRRPGAPRHARRRRAGRVPDRPGREGTRGVELRGTTSCRTSTSCWRPPGLCSASPAALYLAAAAASRPSRRSSTPGRASWRAGAPGHGEAAPGDHLQTGYRLWLAGHQLEHGQPAVGRPVHVPARGGAAGERGLVAVRPALLAARAGARPRARVERLHAALPVRARACSRLLWLRALGLSRVAAAAGGLAFEIAPYRRRAEPRAPARADLAAPPARALGVRAGPREPASSAGGGRSRAALVSIPLSGQVHLALGAIPFYLLYAICRTRGGASWLEAGIGAAAAVLAGVLIRLTVISGSIDAGRPVAQRGARLLGDRPRPRLAPRPPRRGGVRLPRLADAARRPRRPRRPRAPAGPRLAAVLGLGALVPVLLALGTHFPLYSPLWHALPPFRYPRVPERLMPIACLALAALAAFAIDAGLRRPAARHLPRVALAVASPSCCSPTCTSARSTRRRPTARTAPTPPSRRAPAGRLLELPVFPPDIHYGSVYLYYDQRVRRERPAGYSTTAPRAPTRSRGRSSRSAAATGRPAPATGWTTSASRRSPSTAASTPTPASATRPGSPGAGSAHGWRPLATGGPVTAFVRGRADCLAAVPEPPRARRSSARAGTGPTRAGAR